MTSNNPIIFEEKVYDLFALSFVINETVNGVATVVTLTPARQGDNGLEVINDQEYKKTFVFSDVYQSEDVAVQTASYKIKLALQEFINAKNL